MRGVMLEYSLKKSETIISKYCNETESFHYIIWDGVDVKVCFVVDNSDVSFAFDLIGESAVLNAVFYIPAKVNEKVSLDIRVNLLASATKSRINIYSLSEENASIKIDWNLFITDWISQVTSDLKEEALIVWKSKYVSLIPSLKVASPEVVATHWAKIHRISDEKLFYMQSRGLDVRQSVQMVVESYAVKIVDELGLSDYEKNKFYSMIWK